MELCKGEFACCGLAEFSGVAGTNASNVKSRITQMILLIFNGDNDEDVEDEVARIVENLFGDEQRPDADKITADILERQPEAAHFILSDTSTGGPFVASFLLREGLGSIAASPAAVNPNTKRQLRAWIWTPDLIACRRWFTREIVAPAIQKEQAVRDAERARERQQEQQEQARRAKAKQAQAEANRRKARAPKPAIKPSAKLSSSDVSKLVSELKRSQDAGRRQR